MKTLRLTDRADANPAEASGRADVHGSIVCPILYGLTAGLSDCAIVMPRENANELLLEELRRPDIRIETCIAAVLCADPFIHIEKFLSRLSGLGVQTVANWPSGIFFEGTTANAMKAVPAGFEQELDWMRQAGRSGLDVYMVVVSREQGLAALSAGITRIILHPGLSYGPDMTALAQLEKSLASIARDLRAFKDDCEIWLYRHPNIFGTAMRDFGWADGTVDYEVAQ